MLKEENFVVMVVIVVGLSGLWLRLLWLLSGYHCCDGC